MPTDERYIDVEISDHVATLTLNRPDKLNAWAWEAARQLAGIAGEGGHAGLFFGGARLDEDGARGVEQGFDAGEGGGVAGVVEVVGADQMERVVPFGRAPEEALGMGHRTGGRGQGGAVGGGQGVEEVLSNAVGLRGHWRGEEGGGEEQGAEHRGLVL